MPLKEFVFGQFTIAVSNQRMEEDRSLVEGDVSRYLRHVLLRLLGRGDQFLGYLAFIYAYMRKQKAFDAAILDAHGYDTADDWLFWDDREYIPVQHWVSAHDGRYPVLFLHVCNPGNYCIFSEKSLVVTPRTDLSLYAQLENRVKTELYLPRRGFVDQLNIEAEFARIHDESLSAQKQYVRDHFEELIGL